MTGEHCSSAQNAATSWELKPAEKFEEPEVRETWQYKALEMLRTDSDVTATLLWQPHSVYDLADTAHDEKGFFAFLAVSCRKYICKDKKLRAKIESEVKAAKIAGLDPKHLTPERLVIWEV